MPRARDNDTKFLELHRGKWRVTVAVPRALHAKLGTRLKRALHTDSRAVANGLKWPVVAELQAIIDRARPNGVAPSLKREALDVAAVRASAVDPDTVEDLDWAIQQRGDEIRGDPVEVLADEGSPEYLYDAERERQAGEYVALAKGDIVPLDHHHSKFIAEARTTARTKADDERALKYLIRWCEEKRLRAVLQTITPAKAAQFVDELPSLTGIKEPATLNKYIGRLAIYWAWMKRKRLHLTEDVWSGLKIRVPETKHDERERDFTDDELRQLLNGPAAPRMHDLMRIAALTGARLDAIVDLKVGHCQGGVFVFKPQKKERDPRAVPIHPALLEIVARRVEGKGLAQDLFPEWPAPKKEGSQRERSFKASNQFTDYRRLVGVEELVDGKRRSLVNFHSFRRWFITRAERADQPEHIIAAVVGHKRKGITLGRYSSGPALEQARRCVEAVQLPT